MDVVKQQQLTPNRSDNPTLKQTPLEQKTNPEEQMVLTQPYMAGDTFMYVRCKPRAVAIGRYVKSGDKYYMISTFEKRDAPPDEHGRELFKIYFEKALAECPKTTTVESLPESSRPH